MDMEKERGFQLHFCYCSSPIKESFWLILLDTQDMKFSEDTYRTLTAVWFLDLMVIDCCQRGEARTIKLIGMTRYVDTPIITFMNKWIRDSRTIDLLDELKNVFTENQMLTYPWPIGMGKELRVFITFSD